MDYECISKEPLNLIDPEQIEFEIDNEVCFDIIFDRNTAVSYHITKTLVRNHGIELHDGEIILNAICCEIQFDSMSIKKKGTLYLTNYKMQFLIYNVYHTITILFFHFHILFL